MQIQVLFNGAINSVNNNIFVAQNNYWGASPVSPSTFYALDYDNNRVGPLLLSASCVAIMDLNYKVATSFDARFPFLANQGKDCSGFQCR